ncbi:MAG: IS3 family transposase [Nitrospirae bacterium]|nr:IS3 family transposase [Nitrospirota bacterium]
MDIIHNKRLFNQALVDYVNFYNTKRFHKSLKKKTPIQFIIDK